MTEVLTRLAAVIKARRDASASSSYTKSLLDKGIAACAKKLGEEAVETIIAAMSETDDKLQAEAADLLYHLLVVLEARHISIQDVFDELDQRTSQSGHQEKASRSTSGFAT